VLEQGKAIKTALVDATGGFSTTLSLSYGQHTLSFNQRNSGGTSAVTTITVKMQQRPPPPLLTSPSNNFDTTNTRVPFSGSGTPGATVTVTNGSISAQATVDASSRFSGTLTLTYGTHSLSATQVSNGLTSLASGSVQVKVRPPVPVLTTAPADGYTSYNQAIQVAGTGVAGATLNVLNNGALITTLPINSTGNFAGNFTLPAGSHKLSFSQALGGLTSQPTPLLTIHITPVPIPTITAPTDGAVVVGNSIVVSGQGLSGATITVFEQTTVLGTVQVDAAGSFSTTVTLGNGRQHTLSFTQSIWGGTSSQTAPITVTTQPNNPRPGGPPKFTAQSEEARR
jgi:hypothetical protein